MITYLANPARFLRFAKYATPISGAVAAIALIIGLYLSLSASPPAEYHGENVRFMYIHVPAAWCAMAAYTGIAIASLISFIWRHPLADSAARSLAWPGAGFTFLTLFTGSLWGKVAWGTWWQWDGRMTSVLVLLFIYLGYIALWNIIEDRKRAARLASILAMIGWINIPIIKFSVEWWNSLHQPATLSMPDSPGLPSELLLPLAVMTLGYTALLIWLALRGTEAQIIQQREERQKTQSPATATIETV